MLFLSACDSSPTSGAKASRDKPAVLVNTVLVKQDDVSRTIERNGSLQAHREVRLSLQQEGLLLTLPHHEGDRVSQGDLLAQLDDTLLRIQLKKAQAHRRQAEQDLKRLKQLQSSRVVSEDDLARAVTALDVSRAEEEELRILLQQARITAPFDGIISQRLAEPGDSMSRFSQVLTLIDTHRLYTKLKLSDMLLTGLQLGDEVSLTIDALGPQRFSATINRIHPVVDESSRQGTIEVILNSTPAGARPGQLCRVQLQVHSSSRLLVPYSALRRDSRGEFLFTVDGNNKIKRQPIVSGLHFDEMVEILKGLNIGERIVTRGFLGLSEGSTVKLADKKASL